MSNLHFCPDCGTVVTCDKPVTGHGAPTHIQTSNGIVMNVPEQIESD